LYAIALFASIAAGAALPLMTLIFGQLVTKFNAFESGQSSANTFRNDVSHFVCVCPSPFRPQSRLFADILTRLWFIYLFIAKFCLVYMSSVTLISAWGANITLSD